MLTTSGRPEGPGLTVSSTRSLWKLPTESNSYLRSLPVGLGCPTGSRKQLTKKNLHSESHELSTAKAWWRCLTPSLATGQRHLASAQSNTLPRTRILQEYLAGTRDPTVGDIACAVEKSREFQPLSLQPPPGPRDD